MLNHEFLAQVLAYAQASNEALKEAQEIVSSVKREKSAAATRIDNVVARMRDAGLIYPHEAQEAKEALARHDRAIEILGNCVEEVRQLQAKKSAELGSPQDEPAVKSASLHSWRPVGHRYGENEFSPADAALFRLIGR